MVCGRVLPPRVGYIAGSNEQIAVADGVAGLEEPAARLARAEELARSPDLQVFLGQEEAVLARDDRVDPLLRLIARIGAGDQEALRGVASPADPASKLMKLGDPESLRLMRATHKMKAV